MKISWVLRGVLIFILILEIVRIILPAQIDDVSPEIPCEDWILAQAETYYIIPRFNEKKISGDLQWCDKILGGGKELAMHGVYHKFNEFEECRNESYFNAGLETFEECFNETPERFKPPQLGWTKKNNWIKERVEVDLFFNQLFHKVYHCNDTGIFPNWLIKLI
jgi:hypothetical protein